jgi:Pyruvate/2-oxoacid:ferredoxin oxidoreductase delta subunit
MLLDLNALVHPRLYVMDGIMAMEGNGPRGGRPVRLGVILLSDDPVALDSIACRIIDVDPMLVPTVRLGQELGYGRAGVGSVELCGDDIDVLVSSSFDIDRKKLRPLRTRGVMRFFRNRLVPKPVMNTDRCLRCGICVRMCPADPKAVDWMKGNKKKPPVYDYSRCIRCYCCQELCPEKAIRLKKPLLRRLFSR